MEQRSEPRVLNDIKFFVHVQECKEDNDLAGTSIACEAVDVSVHGLQFRTDDPLYSGNLLNITIGIGKPFAMYLLRGEVRWAKEEEGAFYMGILLKDEDGTDLDKWRASFSETFA
jgi:hypothetical protein